MPEYTPRANMYLPGGGLSGTIPDEEVDIDKINNNFRALDNLVGAPECTSTTRPANPINGHLAFESDTRNLIRYSATSLRWEPVGVPNCPSEAYRNDMFGAVPAAGSRAFRLDRFWLEEYFTTDQVTVAGWYPVEGRLPRIDMQQNGSLVTFGGGAWTPIRDSWNWAPAKQLNVTGVLAIETGSFKTLIPGTYIFEYSMDLNMASGALILAISAFTAINHAFADDRAIASSTFPEASSRAGGKVSTGPILMEKDRYVQGNIFPDINGTLDAARKTTNNVSARYVGPPFKA